MKKLPRAIFHLFVFSLVTTHSLAQEAFIRSGELLIQLQPDESLDNIFKSTSRRALFTSDLISDRLRIYRLKFADDINLARLKSELEEDPRIAHSQYNHILKRRGGTAVPNDPLFSEQWYLERIGAIDLWDQTTGGITPCGDSIVIAVFDFGIDPTHEDMQNIWTNRAEIEGNEFDDDANGYVDDYRGLNLDTGNDNHAIDPDFHGTAVASVVGASSNNGKGITGLNWNIQLMIISSIEKDEALAIEAFEYIIDQRKKYNESNGTEGAYVVAVNNSWGREGLFEEDFPLLCGMFDELGAVGILSVGSTENDQVNTDVFGDIPSDCSSDFLIVVTNTDENDELSIGGFGKENVDLGAPGENIRVVAEDDSYGFDSGTSFSAPIVTGAIGLLYSLPQATFCDNARLSPTDAIRDLKRFILDGVEPIATLADRTVSGGRLDLSKTADLVTATSEIQVNLIQVHPNPSSGMFQIDLVDDKSDMKIEVINSLGQAINPNEILRARKGHYIIDGTNLPSGQYFVKLKNESTLYVAKVIKF